MTETIVLPVAGLATDPGPFTAAPEGGLAEAQNVVVLRPGVVEPRPGGVMSVDATLKAGGYAARAMYTDPSGALFVWAQTGGGAWIARKSSVTTITGPTAFVSGMVRTAATGGRALTTTGNGVVTLPGQTASPASGSASVSYRAGLPQPAAPSWSLNTGGSLPAGARLRYRVTIRRRLADGTIVESPPSNPIDVLTTLANQAIFLHGAVGPTDPYFAYRTDAWTAGGYAELIAGDELCVYRTASTTAFTTDPGDEYRLRTVIPYNVANDCFCDPTNPPAPWADRLSDTQWNGPALYTNETQEGAALANYRPEYARDVCLYNGMTFYAGAQTTQRLDLHLNAIGGSTQPQTTLRNYVFAGTGTTVIGNPTITAIGAADMAGLFVGQVLQNNGISPLAAAAFPAQTQIVSLTATTATMSANALTAGAVTFRVWDWIDIIAGGTTQRMYVASTGVPVPQNLASRVNYFRDTWAADGGGQGLEVQYNNFPASVGIGNGGAVFRRVQVRVTGGDIDTSTLFTTDMTVSFYANDPSASAFTVRSTKPLAWDAYVDSAVGVTSKPQGGSAVLQWSKINEPEHCPLPYRTTVGDAAYPIRRIEVADNTLLIFKDDGVFQCFGTDPESLQFEMLDRTISLPRMLDSALADEPSKWLGKFGDRVYAMTTRGPMVIGDSGAQPVGAPILETLRRRLGPAYGADYGVESIATRRALMVDVRTRRVGFFIATVAGGSEAWIYDVDMGTWVYWTFAREMAAFGDRISTESMAFAGSYMSGTLDENRTMLNSASLTISTVPTTCERWATETCTINSVTGTGPYTVTIAAGSEWTPQVGDLLIRSGVTHQVSSITSPTVFATLTQPTTGAATWRESYESRVVWLGRAEGNTGVEKQWIAMRLPLELAALSTRYVDPSTSTGRLKSIFRGYRNATLVEDYIDASQSIGASPWPLEPAYVPTDVPSAVASDWGIQAGFSLRQACAWFSTASLVLTYEGGGEVDR